MLCEKCRGQFKGEDFFCSECSSEIHRLQTRFHKRSVLYRDQDKTYYWTDGEVRSVYMAWAALDDGCSENVDEVSSFRELDSLLLQDDKFSADERLEIKNRVDALDREYGNGIDEVCGIFFSGSQTPVASPSQIMRDIVQTFWDEVKRYNRDFIRQAEAIFRHYAGEPFKLGQMISLEPGEIIFARTLPDGQQYSSTVGAFSRFEFYIRALADGEDAVDYSRGMNDVDLQNNDDVWRTLQANIKKHTVTDICRMFTVVKNIGTDRYQVSVVMHF